MVLPAEQVSEFLHLSLRYRDHMPGFHHQDAAPAFIEFFDVRYVNDKRMVRSVKGIFGQQKLIFTYAFCGYYF